MALAGASSGAFLPGLDDGTGPDAADDLAKAMASSSSSSSSSVCINSFSV